MDQPTEPLGAEKPFEARLAIPEQNRSGDDGIPSSGASSKDDGVLQNKAAVLAMLFLVTGALGIPLLWTNKKFSSTERAVWTIVVSAYTLALLFGATAICYWSYRQIVG